MIVSDDPGENRYHCRRCAVTFREPVPEYYDVARCPHCGGRSYNVALAGPRADVRSRTGSAFW